ncbi:MAG: hypothetical protein Q8Q73_10210 [Stagnimonas sp.]|nr:hypothetical protein [Stagnimonas sp.]
MNPDWLSLRELDARAARPKGEAFRAFRRLEAGWQQGLDYRLLRTDDAGAAAEIADLRAQGRIYPSSVSVLLLSPARSAQLLALLSGTGGTPAEAAQSQQ